MKTPPIIFILPEQPKANDKRERNAFGFLKSFGKSYRDYYRRKGRRTKGNQSP